MVAPGLFRGQERFSHRLLDRPNMGFGAVVESRHTGVETEHRGFRVECLQKQTGMQGPGSLSIEARKEDVTHKGVVGSIARTCWYSFPRNSGLSPSRLRNREEPRFGPLALQMAPFPAMCFSTVPTASYSYPALFGVLASAPTVGCKALTARHPRGYQYFRF